LHASIPQTYTGTLLGTTIENEVIRLEDSGVA